MTDIVAEGRQDELVVRFDAPRVMRGLKRMIQLGHRLTDVIPAGTPGEDRADLVRRQLRPIHVRARAWNG